MGSVSRESNGRYRARYRDGDGRTRSRTFDRKSDAQRFLSTTTTDLLRGEFVDPRNARVGFGNVASRWLAGNVNLRQASKVRDETLLRCHVLPSFGHRRLPSITAVEVQLWVNDLSTRLAPRTVRECYRVFGSVLRDAVRAQELRESPCQGIRLPRVIREEQRFLNASEVRRLAEAIGPKFRALVLSAAYLGCRWEELAGLRSENLNLLKAQVRIVGTLEEVRGALRYVPETKSVASRRTLGLPAFLVRELAAHLGSKASGEFVFSGRDGGFLRRSNFGRRHFKPSVAAAGLDSGLRFHDLRHTAAALMISGGVNPLEIQRTLGHSDIKTTLNVYGHLFPDAQERVVSALELFYEASSEPTGGVVVGLPMSV